ncbi:MAG: methionyl-tRNA formyltransferase [Exilispira sp.]
MTSFILFMTSDFGYNVCEYIYKNFEVRAVVTSTPKPKGRHFIIEDIESVKKAKELNIPIIYINKSSEIYSKIHDINADYFVVIDFAFILKKDVLQLPKFYCINIHPSLLPEYRGPSPLHFQIIDNVKKTGISIINMNEKLDAGDILFQMAFELDKWYTFSEFYQLMQERASLAFDIFIKSISFLYPSEQRENLASYTRKILKEDAFIDFEKEDVFKAIGKIKAFEKWPKVKIKVDQDILILLDAELEYEDSVNAGYIKITDNKILIGTSNGTLSIKKIQKAGKSALSTKNFLKGYRNKLIEKKVESRF